MHTPTMNKQNQTPRPDIWQNWLATLRRQNGQPLRTLPPFSFGELKVRRRR
ncbi:MAG: hypothetical protein JSR82_24380 [Verrucomicrobia bacterium]|nr:hypothetical protein [Verrucomicrobiota bacterium]